MIKLNGDEVLIDSKVTIKTLLLDNHYDISRVAVIVNDDIVPKDCYDKQLVRDGDLIEVVSFVGGG